MKKLIFLLILSLIFILNFTPVFAQVSDSFNVALNGNAVGYGYTGDSDVYETNVFTPQTSENGFRRTFTFNNVFSVGMYNYPLSFVDIYSNDAITSNQCDGVGCNIAYNIPISMRINCDTEFCGLGHYDTTNNEYIFVDDNLCEFSGYIYWCGDGTHQYPFLEELQEYFDNSFELRYIYNFLNNNGIQFYYKDLNGTLKTAPASVDMSEISLQIKQHFIEIYNHSIDNSNHNVWGPLNAKGKIYNNAFSEFESIRFFFNYPYTLDNFLFDSIEISVTNFNVNTTITGVIPDFPDTPSLSQQEFAELILDDVFNNSNILNESINQFRNLMPFNNTLSDLFYLVPNFLRTLYESNYTCSSFNLGSIYGSNLTLPCINLQNILGFELFHTIDILISIAFIWYFRRVVISSYKSILFLRVGSNGRGDLDD